MSGKSRKLDTAVVGLGITEMGRIYDRSATQFAADAVRRAVKDAGLRLADLDGLLISPGISGGIGTYLQADLGLKNLALLSEVNAYGSTATAMVQQASLAIQSGLATTVACVFADAPLKRNVRTGSSYGDGRALPPGWRGVFAAYGAGTTTSKYALAARRHMETYGTTSEQFGAIAVAQRAWAQLNPLALMRADMTLADHQASRYIAEPLRLLDCCLVSNGAVAIVVTSAARAADLRQPPAYVRGFAQSHPGYSFLRDERFGLETGAAISGPKALRMAGVSVADIDVFEIYDCYTYTVLVTLEDYGLCKKGEGGPFLASGVLGPKGKLKLNTGGGQLSSYYMWGMTPLSEAIIQIRGHGGERQVSRHELALVSGNGGILDYHASLVLSASQ